MENNVRHSSRNRLDVLMMERHTVSLHLRRGVLFQQFQIIAKARVWKDQAVTSFS